MPKKGLLERLDEGVVIGDGGFVFALEKRGYVKAGPWTPEATVEHPEAVRQLHREFLRAGADVMQAFTFYASDDKLDNRGNEMASKHSGSSINAAACELARQVAEEGDGLMAGGISQTPTYLSTRDEQGCKAEFRKQCKVFGDNKVDFMIVEYFEHVEEIVWAIEVALELKVPVVASMCIGPEGDLHGVSAGECGVRMAKAGANVVGINCHFDPMIVVEGVKKMKEAIEKENIKVHYITQPLGFQTPDASKQGFIDLPEFPFALEPRICTRWEMQKYAREAYNLGVRYIGGCCGFEPYHIRAVAEELAKEHGRFPEGSNKHGMWGEGLRMHTKPWVRARASRTFWEELKPASGRPYCPALSKSDCWGVTAGKDDLVQHKSSTTDDEQRTVKLRAGNK